MDRSLAVLTFVAAVGAGLIAGVFFAFSTFVMKALRRLPAKQGIAAMQAINLAVINPLFLGVFLGTAASALILVLALMRWDRPGAGAGYLVAGGILYFAGTFVVTMRFNVPLNNALAKVDPAARDAEALWTHYADRWTTWNHVRTAAAIAATAAFMLAM